MLLGTSRYSAARSHVAVLGLFLVAFGTSTCNDADLDFGVSGTREVAIPARYEQRATLRMTDGTVYFVGERDERLVLKKLNASGHVDQDFGLVYPDDETGRVVDAVSDGARLFVLRELAWAPADGDQRAVVTAVDEKGEIDTSFGENGHAPLIFPPSAYGYNPFGIGIDADRNIVVLSEMIWHSESIGLFKLDSDGNFADDFGPFGGVAEVRGIPAARHLEAFTVMPNGRIAFASLVVELTKQVFSYSADGEYEYRTDLPQSYVLSDIGGVDVTALAAHADGSVTVVGYSPSDYPYGTENINHRSLYAARVNEYGLVDSNYGGGRGGAGYILDDLGYGDTATDESIHLLRGSAHSTGDGGFVIGTHVTTAPDDSAAPYTQIVASRYDSIGVRTKFRSTSLLQTSFNPGAVDFVETIVHSGNRVLLAGCSVAEDNNEYCDTLGAAQFVFTP